MKSYFELSADERVELEGQAFEDAIRIEAINRGINVPLTLPEELERGLYTRWSSPANAVRFFQLMAPEDYSGYRETGIAFATEEEANRALEGAYAIYREYSGKRRVLNKEFTVQCCTIGDTSVTSQKKVEEYTYDVEEFDKLRDECIGDRLAIQQKRYNETVLQAKKGEYLQLANGDEDIAKAFWSKTESTEWPE